MSYLASLSHAFLWVSRYAKLLPLSQETTVREGTMTPEPQTSAVVLVFLPLIPQ